MLATVELMLSHSRWHYFFVVAASKFELIVSARATATVHPLCRRSAVVPVIARYASVMMMTASAKGEREEEMWDAAHEYGAKRIADTIKRLRGFYVKSGQVFGSRPDLVPESYGRELQPLQDAVDPMPGYLVRQIVESEFGPIDEIFSEWDDAPLGSASVAQVHRATLKKGRRKVAVKVQRPGMASLMSGDCANVKLIAKQLQNMLPLDYYTVFSELEAQLLQEFDFRKEAAAMKAVAESLSTMPGGSPLVVPRPVDGLVSELVLVMDYIPGVPLSQLAKESSASAGREEGERESGGLKNHAKRLLGRRLLRALTESYGKMLLIDGYFHGDPVRPIECIFVYLCANVRLSSTCLT